MAAKELAHSMGCVLCRDMSPDWCLGQIHNLDIVKVFAWDWINGAFFFVGELGESCTSLL